MLLSHFKRPHLPTIEEFLFACMLEKNWNETKWAKYKLLRSLQEKQIAVKICAVPMPQFIDSRTTYVASSKWIIPRSFLVTNCFGYRSRLVDRRWKRKSRIKYKQIPSPFDRTFIFQIMRNSTLYCVQILKSLLPAKKIERT